MQPAASRGHRTQSILQLIPPGAPLWRAASVASVALAFWLSVAPMSVPSGEPGDVVRPDMLLHVVMHAGLASLAGLAWGRAPGAALALGLAIYLEVAQVAAPGRSFNMSDLASNLVGASLGLPAARMLSRLPLWRG